MKTIENIETTLVNGVKVEIKNIPPVLVIGGINGSGKTLLLEEFCRIAEDKGMKYVFIPTNEACNYDFSPEAERIVEKADRFFQILPDKSYSLGRRFLLGIIEKALTSGLELMILDLPENGLHIEIQRHLIDWLQKIMQPKARIILATHGPAIIQEGWIWSTIEMSEFTKGPVYFERR